MPANSTKITRPTIETLRAELFATQAVLHQMQAAWDQERETIAQQVRTLTDRLDAAAHYCQTLKRELSTIRTK